KNIDQFLKNRKQVASWYEQRLNQIEGVQLLKQDDEDHQRSWFVYLIKLDKSINRDKVIKKLKAKGIPSKAYLPAIHLQPYMKKYGYKQGDFPICEAVSNSTLALPFYTGMEESTVDQVCNKLKQSLK
ncbi:DegT/DnrJ/EryC1/StrS family aminotransferase, partial [Patescibacteria group bacterium]|nr:DegT/DnrJ/EryC1/StrS family aminotransferase [Patescibacteria group bacterium]